VRVVTAGGVCESSNCRRSVCALTAGVVPSSVDAKTNKI
jgi:hypothetical protein